MTLLGLAALLGAVVTRTLLHAWQATGRPTCSSEIRHIADGVPNSSITHVTFYYYDVTGNKVVLGTGTEDSSGDWTLTLTLNLASGTYTLYAQAQDNYGVLGDLADLSLTVQ